MLSSYAHSLLAKSLGLGEYSTKFFCPFCLNIRIPSICSSRNNYCSEVWSNLQRSSSRRINLNSSIVCTCYGRSVGIIPLTYCFFISFAFFENIFSPGLKVKAGFSFSLLPMKGTQDSHDLFCWAFTR